MKTESAKAEQRQDRVVSLEIHLAEAMQLEFALRYYCSHAPKYYDSAPHSHTLRELFRVIRNIIEKADPEYAKEVLGEMPESSHPEYKPGNVIIKEVHHHHYHKQLPPIRH